MLQLLRVQQPVIVLRALYGVLALDAFVIKLSIISPSTHNVWPVSPYPMLPILLPIPQVASVLLVINGLSRDAFVTQPKIISPSTRNVLLVPPYQMLLTLL